MTRLETVSNWLQALGYRHERHARGDCLRLGLRGAAADWPALLILDPDDGDLLLLVPAYLRAGAEQFDAERRAALAALLLAVNWELALGGFEMDPADGEVRFRLSLPWVDGALGAASFRRCLEAARYACDAAWGPSQRLLWGDADSELSPLPPDA